MRLEGDWGASKYVLLALVVVELRACVCLLLVAMPSIATSPIGHLVFAHSLPNPVIALVAISSLYIYTHIYLSEISLDIYDVIIG